MGDLLHLSSVPSLTLQNSNDSVLIESLFGPLLGGRGLFSEQCAHDVDMVGRLVLERSGRQEDLIAPKDRQTALAGISIHTRLLHDSLEDRDWHERTIRQLLTDGQSLQMFVVKREWESE